MIIIKWNETRREGFSSRAFKINKAENHLKNRFQAIHYTWFIYYMWKTEIFILITDYNIIRWIIMDVFNQRNLNNNYVSNTNLNLIDV